MNVKQRLPPYQYRYFVLYHVLYYQHDEETLLYHVRTYDTKKDPDLNLLPEKKQFINL